jgi:NAD(P)-dependent dehydrogenase (short-subunit alcohol dehydrogenase family)
LADIQPSAPERARVEIAALVALAIAVPPDVLDADAGARAADSVEAAFGKVHIVCNNAAPARNQGNHRLYRMLTLPAVLSPPREDRWPA